MIQIVLQLDTTNHSVPIVAISNFTKQNNICTLSCQSFFRFPNAQAESDAVLFIMHPFLTCGPQMIFMSWYTQKIGFKQPSNARYLNTKIPIFSYTLVLENQTVIIIFISCNISNIRFKQPGYARVVNPKLPIFSRTLVLEIQTIIIIFIKWCFFKNQSLSNLVTQDI